MPPPKKLPLVPSTYSCMQHKTIVKAFRDILVNLCVCVCVIDLIIWFSGENFLTTGLCHNAKRLDMSACDHTPTGCPLA